MVMIARVRRWCSTLGIRGAGHQMNASTGESIIAVALRHDNGRMNFFLTLGKDYWQADLKEIAQIVLRKSKGYAMDGAPIEAEVCYSLLDAAREPYFYEALFELSQLHLQLWTDPTRAEEARKRLHKDVRSGRHLFYLGSWIHRNAWKPRCFSMLEIPERENAEAPNPADSAGA